MANGDVWCKGLITRQLKSGTQIEVDVGATGIDVLKRSEYGAWLAAPAGCADAAETQQRPTQPARHQIDGGGQ